MIEAARRWEHEEWSPIYRRWLVNFGLVAMLLAGTALFVWWTIHSN